MSAKPVSEYYAAIIARTQKMASFQSRLKGCQTAADRKALIMAARSSGAIRADDAELLIQVYQLETA